MKQKNNFITSLIRYYEEVELQSMWRILVEDKLSDEGYESIETIIDELKRFVPLQYITGTQYFYDQKFIVNEHVLIPRPETEELVEWILTDEAKAEKTVLDLGTGSGCIAITLKSKRANWEVHGMDISMDALNLAIDNANTMEIDVMWHQGDMTKKSDYPIRPDIIVCNPPYVLQSDLAMMSKSTKLFEPQLALYVEDNDPLKYYHAVVENTKDMAPITYYFEIHHLFADDMKLLCEKFGLKNIEIRKDMQGNDRMLKTQG